MSPENKYSEWRVLTPLLLAIIIVAGGIISYLAIDKINTMNDKSDRLFQMVGGVRQSFENYQVTAENRFTRLETQMGFISQKIDYIPTAIAK